MYLLLLLLKLPYSPQRGLNPCQMLLCYQLLCSLERACLFRFSDSLLLPNIISFQHRCKGSSDWNCFTALTLWRDGSQFNYGQLKMIQESPARGIYHPPEQLASRGGSLLTTFHLRQADGRAETQPAPFSHLYNYAKTV